MKKLLTISLAIMSVTSLLASDNAQSDKPVVTEQATQNSQQDAQQKSTVSKGSYLGSVFSGTVCLAASVLSVLRVWDGLVMLQAPDAKKNVVGLQFLATALVYSFIASQAYKTMIKSAQS